ncbi:MAG: hypothetical protein ACRBF0_08940 [Calditrichia bacterium]
MRPTDLSKQLRIQTKLPAGILVKKTLKHVCVFAFFLCLLNQSALADEKKSQLHAAIFSEGARFHSSFMQNFGLGFGLRLRWQPSNLYGFSEFGSIRSEQTFDVISGEASVDIGWQTLFLGAGYSYPLGRNWHLGGEVGVGLLNYRTDALTVDLGAAGSLEIDEQSDNKLIYKPTLVISKTFSGRVHVFIAPAISLVSFSGLKNNLHLKGGIGFALH